MVLTCFPQKCKVIFINQKHYISLSKKMYLTHYAMHLPHDFTMFIMNNPLSFFLSIDYNVSAQWNNLWPTLLLRASHYRPKQCNNSDVSTQWNSLLASIDAQGIMWQATPPEVEAFLVAVATPSTPVHITESDLLSASSEPLQNCPAEDEYYPYPVPFSVLFKHTGHSLLEEERGNFQHAIDVLKVRVSGDFLNHMSQIEFPLILHSGAML